VVVPVIEQHIEDAALERGVDLPLMVIKRVARRKVL